MQLDLGFFDTLLRIPSVTADVPQVNRAVAAMRGWLEARGVPCRVETLGGRDILYAGDGPAPDVLLNAHLDVVPAPPGLFEPVFEEKVVRGRGAQDCKGNALAVASALAALQGGGASAGAIFSTDEETGGATAAHMVSLGFAAKKIVLLLDASPWAITHAQKGILTLVLSAKGRAGHSATPWRSENAIDKLLDGYARLRAAWPAPPEGAGEWHDTFAATVVRGGETFNQIPGEASMVVNIRYTTPGDAERIERFVRETTGLDVAPGPGACPPVFCDETHPEMRRLRDCMARTFDREISFVRLNGATDARHFAGPGKAPVAVLGIEGSGAHAAHEWASFSSIAAYADMIAAFARETAAG